MDPNEKLLLRQAKAGDVAAFEQLVEAYQKKSVQPRPEDDRQS